ncbi:MAG: CocE/NonD family hydrolase, partial [Desulfatitalea sp.]|nr:CocE/NonD family hydrolase [Desulfatitalea sp.]
FKPGTTTFPKGHVHRKGALPLPCDIVFDRDVAVPMRDGITLHIDIFRPPGNGKFPALLAWSPYGKRGGYQTLDLFPLRFGIPVGVLSDLQVWEGPDPAYWCNHGYAVVNVDSRGAFMSEGDIGWFCAQEGKDGYDLIEWLVTQDWSNGKVGMTGNSWLAVIQWFIAAARPPHLTAIAPWEGMTDLYRDISNRGGIPDGDFPEWIASHLYGNNRTADVPAMVDRYPMMNSFWKSQIPELEKINIPAYIVASYTNPVHTRGTLEGFRKIDTQEKWLRIHNTQEWLDYYEPKYIDDLRRFYDHYLKGADNGWQQTPRVRMSVLNPGGKDEIDRPETEFPPARAKHKKLFIDASSNKMTPDPVENESQVSYLADNHKGKTSFSYVFDQDTEVIGYLKLRLWVEAKGSDDMDLFVYLQKLSSSGKVLTHMAIAQHKRLRWLLKFLRFTGISQAGFIFYSGPLGRIRVSHRQLDPDRSTPEAPVLTHAQEERLSPGQIVPVDIELWPTAMRFESGEQLRVLVTGHPMKGSLPPFLKLPKTRSKGDHIIHGGGRYDSHLLIPVVLSRPSGR